MKKIYFVFIFLFSFMITYGQNEEKKIYSVVSKYDFDTTLNNLLQSLKEKQLTIFANFDHHKNAKASGIEMPKSNVIVFGNPKVGTHLMLDNPNIALELPLKIALVEDTNQKTSLIFSNVKLLADKYALKNTIVLEKMQQLIENILKDASGREKIYQ
ncbi:DUF302 domain-containing protein [Capnocytophaga felis]|nr:DUF302 domain-containing protein [Capnocytophaga felis]